ncbi:MAG TPA: prepilin-type N-terminal cleavage/methylation domain-containing protein [Gemmatimonadales bacterium]|jgi:type II secretion system protein G|nr:prepilin-type N-terminal cleavage/methylation domain-containing protein [Gemmatimonadales bacterium]
MSNRKGFTLIELLIVVVIIGILAAIAIPKFAATKDKAKLAALKSDLRNIETAEEAYFADNNVYGDYAAINGAKLFTKTAGSDDPVITVSATGYTAVTSNATITQGDKTCTVDVGNGAANDGEIDCAP